MSQEIFKANTDFIKWIIDQYNEHITIRDKFDEIYIATYFSSEIEYANALNVLISTNHLIGIPPLFRCLFEAHIDLINLCRYEDYYLVLYSIFLRQDIREMEASFKEPENEFLMDPNEVHFDMGEEIKKQRDELERVKKRLVSSGRIYIKLKIVLSLLI